MRKLLVIPLLLITPACGADGDKPPTTVAVEDVGFRTLPPDALSPAVRVSPPMPTTTLRPSSYIPDDVQSMLDD